MQQKTRQSYSLIQSKEDNIFKKPTVRNLRSQDKGIRKPTDEFFGIWAKFLGDIQVARKALDQALHKRHKDVYSILQR